MAQLQIVPSTPPPERIGKIGDISVEVSVDVLQILLLVISSITCIYAFLAKRRVDLSPMSNILARLKPQDFYKDKKIEAILNRMLATGSTSQASVSRVVVALFTNGTKAHLFPFRYFSIFWEVTNEGIAATKFKYQHVPIDKIRDDLELYMGRDNTFISSCVDDAALAPGCKKYLKSCGINTVLGRLIGDKKNGFIGIINLHYDTPPMLSEEQLNNLDSLFTILSAEVEVQ